MWLLERFIVALLLAVTGSQVGIVSAQEGTLKIGVITPLTGPMAPLAPSEGTLLAVEEVNAAGGIAGRKVELIIEDGRCDGRTAANAAQKLIQRDHVKFLLGGQCSIETLTIAPIAERGKVVAIASMSTAPDISQAGAFIFRTSPNSLKQGEMLARYAIGTAKLNSVVIFAEESPYALPIAAGFESIFSQSAGRIVRRHNFNSTTDDFRSLLGTGDVREAKAIVVLAQSIPLAATLVRQMRELGIKVPVLGSETIGNIPSAWPQYMALFEGTVFSQPDFELDQPKARAMIERYNQRFGGQGLKYPYQAEAYDAAKILMEAIGKCGENSEAVRICLQTLQGYQGVSGVISFDENGDAVRNYVIREIRKGKVSKLRS